MIPLIGQSLDFRFYFLTAVLSLIRTVLYFDYAAEGQHEQIELGWMFEFSLVE